MKDTVILTKDEAQKWEALSAALRKGWRVEAETGTAYESAKELEMRRYMFNAAGKPAVHALKEKLQQGRLEEVKLADIPADVADEFFFSIGAAGLTTLLRSLLLLARTDQEIGTLALLSHMRHSLLRANADCTK